MGKAISWLFIKFCATFDTICAVDEIIFKRLHGRWSKTITAVRKDEKKMRKLKVGVIGCGQVAQIVWLPYIHELDEYDIVAISDISLILFPFTNGLIYLIFAFIFTQYLPLTSLSLSFIS